MQSQTFHDEKSWLSNLLAGDFCWNLIQHQTTAIPASNSIVLLLLVESKRRGLKSAHCKWFCPYTLSLKMLFKAGDLQTPFALLLDAWEALSLFPRRGTKSNVGEVCGNLQSPKKAGGCKNSGCISHLHTV